MSFKNIGWIGIGVMGRAMCEHILNAEYAVHVYNQRKNKVESFLDEGVHLCKNSDYRDVRFELMKKSFDQTVFSVNSGPDRIGRYRNTKF